MSLCFHFWHPTASRQEEVTIAASPRSQQQDPSQPSTATCAWLGVYSQGIKRIRRRFWCIIEVEPSTSAYRCMKKSRTGSEIQSWIATWPEPFPSQLKDLPHSDSAPVTVSLRPLAHLGPFNWTDNWAKYIASTLESTCMSYKFYGKPLF